MIAVIPAQAGIQTSAFQKYLKITVNLNFWIPTYTGMTMIEYFPFEFTIKPKCLPFFGQAFSYVSSIRFGSIFHRPAYLAACAHRDEFAVAIRNACGDGLALFDEGDRVGVFGNAVEPCAVSRGKGFEFVQRACFFKYFGVKLDGGHGTEHAGAAAGVFFGGFGVRRRIGAEEEFVRLLAGNGDKDRKSTV